MKVRIICICMLIMGLAMLLLKYSDESQLIKSPTSTLKTSKSSEDVGQKQHISPQPNDIAKHFSATDEAIRPRDQNVVQGLQRFMEKTANITKQSIDEERARIIEGTRLAQGAKPQPPHVSKDLDENGNYWQVLEFGNGIVRYVPFSEE